MKRIFNYKHVLSTVEQEVIARQLVRSIEKLPFVKVVQLEHDTWTKLDIHIKEDKYLKVFKSFKDKRFKLNRSEKGFYIFIGEEVTPIDVRSFVGEVYDNYKNIDRNIIVAIRQYIGLKILKLAKLVYPKREKK